MTASAFAALAAGCAMAILLVVDLRVPFLPLRRWLLSGPYVATADEIHGPWWVQVGDEVQGDEFDTPAKAAANLTWGQRLRAWGGEWISCPWCCGGWIALVAIAAFALHAGPGVLWFWLPLWFASSVSVVIERAIGNLP